METLYITLGIITGSLYYLIIILNLMFKWSTSPALIFSADSIDDNDDVMYVCFSGLIISLIVALIYPILYIATIMYFIIITFRKHNKK